MVDEGLDRVAVVVEDDQDVRNLLIAVLTQAGFDTHAVETGAHAIEAVRRHQPVVTTLDVNLPDIDGFEVARRLRAFSTTYIVMLTARTTEVDTLQGLEAGADDYLVKPFRPRELRARIAAMLRRPRMPGVESASAVAAAGSEQATAAVTAATVITEELEPAGDWLEHDGLRINESRRIVERDGERVALTRSEFELLRALVESGGRVQSKAALARAMRPEGYSTSEYVSPSEKRTVEVHLANLRAKLGDDRADPRWIETVRGIGYRLPN